MSMDKQLLCELTSSDDLDEDVRFVPSYRAVTAKTTLRRVGTHLVRATVCDLRGMMSSVEAPVEALAPPSENA